jgi:colanic acid/amylovoran biosynthesis protein
MRVFIDPGTYDFTNLGCAAVLSMAVERLQTLSPRAIVEVLTDDDAGLAQNCPGATAVPEQGARIWYGDTELLGRLHSALPVPLSAQMARSTRRLRAFRPRALRRLLSWKAKLAGRGDADVSAFLEAVGRADLIAISGLGGLRGTELQTLDTLEMALRLGRPTAMFSLGLSGAHSPQVAARARALFPRVGLIAVRDRQTSLGFLDAVSVPQERIVVTGDDAVELAYRERPARRGDGLGLNLRVQRTAEVDESFIDRLKPVVQRFARERGAPLVALPGANGQASHDSAVLQRLLAGYHDASDGGASFQTARAVAREAGRCRAVLTGAYHVGVFALSQGVPTVCIGRSPYFLNKLRGLADMFGAGCEVVPLDSPELETRLETALSRAWTSGEEVCQSLLGAAERQISAARAAYAQAVAMCSPPLEMAASGGAL